MLGVNPAVNRTPWYVTPNKNWGLLVDLVATGQYLEKAIHATNYQELQRSLNEAIRYLGYARNHLRSFASRPVLEGLDQGINQLSGLASTVNRKTLLSHQQTARNLQILLGLLAEKMMQGPYSETNVYVNGIQWASFNVKPNYYASTGWYIPNSQWVTNFETNSFKATYTLGGGGSIRWIADRTGEATLYYHGTMYVTDSKPFSCGLGFGGHDVFAEYEGSESEIQHFFTFGPALIPVRQGQEFIFGVFFKTYIFNNVKWGVNDVYITIS